MKTRHRYFGWIIIFFISCQEPSNKAVVEFKSLEKFPQEIIATQLTENFVRHTDTFQLKSEKETQIELTIDRPKFVYVQKEGEMVTLFIEPESELTISKEDDGYIFKGDLSQENAFLEEVKNNEELRGKVWDYKASFDTFKKQVSAYFKYKEQLMDEYFPDKPASYFYKLNEVDDKAFNNLVILDYINTQEPKGQRDSLFFKYFDMDLLDFKEMEAYIDASRLRGFYSRYGVEYYMRKKYGEQLDSVQKENEFYVLRNDITSAYFNQPLKSILIYDDLRYYPEEFDFAPDSLTFTSPKDMLARYKNDLSEEAYTALTASFEKYKAKKQRYAKGALVPEFLLTDASNNNLKLKPSSFQKPVLIDVWASWCGPCIKSFPKIKKLENEYDGKLEVVSISIDKDFDLYKKALDELEIPGKKKLYADGAWDSDFAHFFQVTAIPRYMLIDKKGKVVNGNLNIKDIDALVKEQL